MISFTDIKNDEAINTYIRKADESLGALGYTEHSFAHVTSVAMKAREILTTLGYSKHECELAEIAGYLHDIGNMVNRTDHAQSGAIMAFRILDRLGAEPEEIATIVSAIGNHDEGTAVAVNAVAAALILADKTDVRRSRVRNRDFATFDIHDRVNYAVKKSSTNISEDKKSIILTIDIDTEISAVMDYFEIFLERMMLCRKAAEKLNLKFQLVINNQVLL
ncbi:HD domain-containing protein [Clostridium sp. MSJ-8]|jgi:metal-dependent HD superfamily phosphatase/phosphodiesterase|uniref:HD domain-containing protein n=1 Tax=Clostridium sp. MSJ-8 TaxID=2841510 RepID=UPI001C0ED005|nr:HD domain-containing protein [Clostridium sp. MSJ-8]MBU5487621.1 HD domain-containing protein [Clostridium sp. MSJ-8]